MSDSSRRDRYALVALALILSAVAVVAVFEIGLRHYAVADELVDSQFQLFGDTPAQWVMAVFAVLATAVSWRAVVLVRKTWEEARRTAEAADESNRTARQIGEAQTRAYVTPVNCKMRRVVVGQRPLARVVFENSGVTPATNVTVRGTIYVAVSPQPKHPLRALTSTDRYSTGIPGKSGPAVIEIPRLKVFTESEKASIEFGTHAFYVYVVIEYFDVFGKYNCSRTIFSYSDLQQDICDRAPHGNSFEWGVDPTDRRVPQNEL